MSEECQNNIPDTPGTLLDVIEPVELWATYPSGGSLAVTRFDDDQQIGVAIGEPPECARETRHIVVSINEDSIGGTPMEAVAIHSDMAVHADRHGLADLERAIVALQAAREALLTITVARS